MKLFPPDTKQSERGTTVIFLILVLVLVSSIAALAVYVTSSLTVQHQRNDWTAAEEYADGGAAIACKDLETAFTNQAGTFLSNLVNSTNNAYTLISTTTSNKVYQRTISSPFTNQTVTAQIWVTNTSAPPDAMVVAMATVRRVTVTNSVHLLMPFAYGAAIISINPGTLSDTSINKTAAQTDGNVVVNGNGSGPMVVDGGKGLAILANGLANISATNLATVSRSAVSMTNYGTASEIPDYTSLGTANALFDINRFLAVANATPGGYALSGNNHFTNLATFITAVVAHPPATPMQGVVAVDIWFGDKQLGSLTSATLPNGINVKGTLLFNFLGTGWDATTSKIIINADININPADLSHLVPANTATYTTGYPPTYTDSTKNPININISPAYQNFTSADDLPALVYSIGVVDFHGGLNISGVVYTPSYMEIENKSNETQYIKGALIMGHGIYYENTSSSTSIVSYDANAVGSLATSNNVGKRVIATYWQ
jgi:hypothetical protein